MTTLTTFLLPIGSVDEDGAPREVSREGNHLHAEPLSAGRHDERLQQRTIYFGEVRQGARDELCAGDRRLYGRNDVGGDEPGAGKTGAQILKGVGVLAVVTCRVCQELILFQKFQNCERKLAHPSAPLQRVTYQAMLPTALGNTAA